MRFHSGHPYIERLPTDALIQEIKGVVEHIFMRVMKASELLIIKNLIGLSIHGKS